MISALLALALQSAPAAEAPPISSFDELPIEEAAASRCSVAFAVVTKWQSIGDQRGADYPDMITGGGREFFVRTLARLIDNHGLQREDVTAIITREFAKLDTPEGQATVEQMMPACLLMKQSAGL